MSDPSKHDHWLLNRHDQAAVAGLVLISLAGMGLWWAWHGGRQGRLTEIDGAEPLNASFKVDVNSAGLPELMQLPGVGPKLARRIVESRETGGPFAGDDDLLRVRGIGRKILERIRPYLSPMPGNVKETENKK